jgi:hypothetical protein
LSPTLELPFDAVELPLDAALVPYEAPWVDLSTREVEEDEFGFVVAGVICVAIIATVAVVAMVTDHPMEAHVDFGPLGMGVRVY